jgi:hypothetical protein
MLRHAETPENEHGQNSGAIFTRSAVIHERFLRSLSDQGESCTQLVDTRLEHAQVRVSKNISIVSDVGKLWAFPGDIPGGNVMKINRMIIDRERSV